MPEDIQIHLVPPSEPMPIPGAVAAIRDGKRLDIYCPETYTRDARRTCAALITSLCRTAVRKTI